MSKSPTGTKPTRWAVYLLLCKGGRTYAGMAKDVEARFALHAIGKGARFTRANPPEKILGVCFEKSKNDALKAEHRLKKLTKEKRLAWAEAHPYGSEKNETG